MRGQTPGSALWASAEVLELLYRTGLTLSENQRQKLLSLDQKSSFANGQVDLIELDLSGDGQVTPKEIQFVLSWSRQQLAGEGRYRLKTQPRLLPNRTISGNLQLHINNPEQIRDPGLLFDSQRLQADTTSMTEQPPLPLGMGSQGNFDVYAYVNYQALRNAYANRPGPDGQPLQAAWYVYRLHNPVANPPLEISLQGSGLINDGIAAHVLRMLRQLPAELSLSDRLLAAQQIQHATRSQDADLQYRALTNQGQTHDQTLWLAPGKSLLIARPLPFKGASDYRGQYRFAVNGQAREPLHFQAGVLTTLPAGQPLPGSEGIWNDLDPTLFSPTLAKQLGHWIEPRADGSTQYLKPSSDFSSPAALAAELRQVQYPALLKATQELAALWTYLDAPETAAVSPTEPTTSAPPQDEILDPTSLPETTAAVSPLTGDQASAVASLPAFLHKNAAPLPALAKLKADLAGHTAASLMQAWLSPAELEGYLLRLDQLAGRLEQVQAFDEALMRELRAWNAETKMLPRVLAQAAEVSDQTLDPNLKAVLKTFEHRFWGCLIALGRVNGVVPGQIVRAHLPAAELAFQPQDRQREWNFLLNSNPLNTGGVLTSQPPAPVANGITAADQIDALPMHLQRGQTQHLPVMDYGQYGVRYQISGQFRNESDGPLDLQVRFGSSDEMGHLDWRSLFDQSDSLMGDSSTRFTGTVRVESHSAGQVSVERLVSFVHQRVQAPQPLLVVSLAAGEQREVRVDLVVPTNSTGPQVLQFKLERRP